MLWLALASHAFLSASPSIRARVAPPSIAATAEAEPVRMRVTVPAGVAAGDPLHVSTPAGELLIVTVPAGLQTGDPFDILVPASPPPPPPLSAAQAGGSSSSSPGGDLPLVLSRAELERSQLPADAPDAGRFEELPLGPQLEPRGSIGERLGCAEGSRPPRRRDSPTPRLAASRRGACVLRVPDVASSDEAAALLSAALSARSAQVERRGKPPSRGRARLPVSEPSLFGRARVGRGSRRPSAASSQQRCLLTTGDSVETCEEVLLRVLDLCDEAMPSLHETLFAPREGWRERQPRNAQGSQPEVPPPPGLNSNHGLNSNFPNPNPNPGASATRPGRALPELARPLHGRRAGVVRGRAGYQRLHLRRLLWGSQGPLGPHRAHPTHRAVD